ncbi:MAG: hypothetical protein J5654_09600 [Victivallales bacterium]|nr:hypothetical protein [Victivallales bacterium]
MSKKKIYCYVLVFTPDGPKFVTSSDYSTRTCKWDGDVPQEHTESDAQWTAMGLTFNGFYSVPVASKVEIKHQPYNYADGKFVWEWNNAECGNSNKEE